MKTLGIIDIGSNSIKLIIVEINNNLPKKKRIKGVVCVSKLLNLKPILHLNKSEALSFTQTTSN